MGTTLSYRSWPVRKTLLRVKEVPGPTGIIAAMAAEQEVELAAHIVAAYSDVQTGKEAIVEVSGKEECEITVSTPAKEEFRELLV